MLFDDPKLVWENRSRIRFRGAASRDVQHGLPEVGFRWPEPVAILDEGERDRRALIADDFCILDGRRHFVCVTLSAPVAGYDCDFTWAVWTEVEWTAFKCYWDRFADTDNSAMAAFKGRLANKIPGFARTLGLSGRIVPQPDGNRPRLTLAARRHPLALAQRNGITPEQAVEQAKSVGTLLMMVA